MKKEMITAHARTHTLTLNGIIRNLTFPLYRDIALHFRQPSTGKQGSSRTVIQNDDFSWCALDCSCSAIRGGMVHPNQGKCPDNTWDRPHPAGAMFLLVHAHNSSRLLRSLSVQTAICAADLDPKTNTSAKRPQFLHTHDTIETLHRPQVLSQTSVTRHWMLHNLCTYPSAIKSLKIMAKIKVTP